MPVLPARKTFKQIDFYDPNRMLKLSFDEIVLENKGRNNYYFRGEERHVLYYTYM